jgi:hypothetical protein
MPVRHLLAQLMWPHSRSARRILAWSWWHGFHRGIASYYHTKRRRDRPADPSWLFRSSFGFVGASHLFPRSLGNFLEVWQFQEFRCVLSPVFSFLKGDRVWLSFLSQTELVCLAFIGTPLHHWLLQANVPFIAHPMDARIKCVTEEQIQQVAALHSRPLHAPATIGPVKPKEQALPTPEPETGQQQTTQALPTFFSPETELIQRLLGLETRVVTLQEQVAQLALTRLEERERSVEHRITTLESLMQPVMEQVPHLPVLAGRKELACPILQPRPLHPADHLARSRRPPLIEYSAPGLYVIVAKEGEVHVEPDSRAWFDWLATLSSFRFVGPAGRFTAHRGYKQGRAYALLVGFSLRPPSYLQALSWHDREFDDCQPGAYRGLSSSGHRHALGFCAFPCP